MTVLTYDLSHFMEIWFIIVNFQFYKKLFAIKSKLRKYKLDWIDNFLPLFLLSWIRGEIVLCHS